MPKRLDHRHSLACCAPRNNQPLTVANGQRITQELRPLARAHQKCVYGILFRTSAASLKKLARDPKHLGGEAGMVGVLHTWTRDLAFHPHVHCLVAGGALSRDGQKWMPAKAPDFLVPVKALSLIFRAKLRHALQKADLSDAVPQAVWRKDWVVHCLPVGSGKKALQYLATYVYRVALSNNRIEKQPCRLPAPAADEARQPPAPSS